MSETPLDDLKNLYPFFTVKNNTALQQTLNLRGDSVGIMPYSSANLPSELFNSFPEKPTFEITNILMDDLIKVGLIKVTKPITNVEPAAVTTPVDNPVSAPSPVVQSQPATPSPAIKPVVKE